MKRIILFLIIILSLVSAGLASAASVGVKPKELNLEVLVGVKKEAEILVFNSGEEPALYNISPDAFGDKISVAPSDFRLEPGGSQVVAVSIKTWIPKKFSTNFSIVSRPLGAGNMPTAAGVKIPIIVAISSLILWRILGIAAGICFLALVVVKLKYKK